MYTEAEIEKILSFRELYEVCKATKTGFVRVLMEDLNFSEEEASSVLKSVSNQDLIFKIRLFGAKAIAQILNHDNG